jgi:putative endonuclease
MLILPMPFGASQPPKPTPVGPATVFPWGREQELLASCHVRQLHTGTLYIGVTSNLYLRVMQHKEGTWKGFTAACGCKRVLYFEGYEDIRKAIAREKQLKGWRGEKKLNLIRTINPEFKHLAQTWGWKMITAHEKMYPWPSAGYLGTVELSPGRSPISANSFGMFFCKAPTKSSS